MSFNCVINGKGFTTFENMRLKNALESQSRRANHRVVIDKVQSGWIVDQHHRSVYGSDLGVKHTLAHITHNHWWAGERGRERAHPHLPTMQSTQPWVPPLAHPHIITLFECIGIDLMDEPQSPRANHGVVVISHATK